MEQNEKPGRTGTPRPRPGLATSKILLVYAIMAVAWVAAEPLLFRHPWHLHEGLNHVFFVGLAGVLLFACVYWANRALAECAASFEDMASRATAYFDSSPQAILTVDERGLIDRANLTAIRMFGYGSEELEGMQIERLVPERFRDVHKGHRAKYMAAPHTFLTGVGREMYGRRKDGSEFPIEVGLNLVWAAGQRLVICVITDISERLHLEREASRTETLRAFGAVAAGIAHELNNPLAIVSSRAELILSAPEDRALPDEMREDLEVIHRNAQRASQIAHGLLEVARQRRQGEQREPVDVNSVIDDTLLLLADQLKKDGIGLSTTLDRRLPKVLGNGPALGQVLINLIMNARDALLPRGGTIAIRTSPAADAQGWLELAIKDTGCGVPPEALDRLFSPFYSTKPTGTGLGLWLSKRTVSEHRGTITAESEPGKGATFIIRLPSIGDGQAAEQ